VKQVAPTPKPFDVLESRRTGLYVLPSLLPRIKRVIDQFFNVPPSDPHFGKKWKTCAIVGNSGTLLEAEYGPQIGAHEMVMRINLAPVKGFEAHVGPRTDVNFINGHRLHYCTQEVPGQEGECACFPYGRRVPVLMYLWAEYQYDDLAICKLKHPKEKFIVLDGAVKHLATEIIARYSKIMEDKREREFYEEQARLEQQRETGGLGEEGEFRKQRFARRKGVPEYSSGMEAITVLLTLCNSLSIFGFGKREGVQHHYWENTTLHEYGAHDYSAEQLYYDDLVNNRPVPLLSSAMHIPQVKFFD